MKKGIMFLIVFAVALGLSMPADAALELRGTDSLGNRLIYDTDLNITWYDYTKSSAYWDTQMAWADTLSVSGGDLVGVYDDWRLPTALNQDGTGPCYEYNCTNSEMGHLYYTELRNVASPPSSSLQRTGDFQHLKSGFYWSGTEYSADPSRAWVFTTHGGFQYPSDKDNYDYAVAVRPGDVSVAVVPEPMSMILFGVGGVVMAARRKLLRRRG